MDEFTHSKLSSTGVIETLAELMLERGVPEHVRSDNRPEFVAQAGRDRIAALGSRAAYIEPGSPRENGYAESFNSKLRDEPLNGENVRSLRDAQVLIKGWRRHTNAIRPLSAPRGAPPAPEVRLAPLQIWPAPTLAHHPDQPPSTLQPRSGAGYWRRLNSLGNHVIWSDFQQNPQILIRVRLRSFACRLKMADSQRSAIKAKVAGELLCRDPSGPTLYDHLGVMLDVQRTNLRPAEPPS